MGWAPTGAHPPPRSGVVVTTSADSLGVAELTRISPASDAQRLHLEPMAPSGTVRAASSETPAGSGSETDRTEGARDTASWGEAEALQWASELADRMNRSLRFYVDEPSGRLAVKIVDRQSGDVVRYIPPEQVLRAAARLAEAIDILFGKDRETLVGSDPQGATIESAY